MRKYILFCLLSVFAGGFVALMWFEGPPVEPQSVAQEASPWSPSRGNAPVADPPAISNANQPAAADMQNLTPDEQVNVMVYINVNRSVVNINTKGVQTDRFMLFEVPTEGEGSGTVLDRQGHILTNFHVIDGAKQIHVTLFDGGDYEARLIGV
ncbi:MAG TPA: hypothetical protein VIH42_08625, partial [Thermoguttaceae bacterium]